MDNPKAGAQISQKSQYRKTCYEELGKRLAQRSSSFLS